MREKTVKRVRRVAYDGVFAALAFALSYVEFLIPMDFVVPGVKIGLANIVSLFVLYRIGIVDAAAVSLVRILLAGFLFNADTIMYGLFGATFSLLVMALLKKTDWFSVTVVSMLGAIAHNFGQILWAAIRMRTMAIAWHFLVLVVSGLIGGCAVGLLAAWILRRFEKHVKL